MRQEAAGASSEGSSSWRFGFKGPLPLACVEGRLVEEGQLSPGKKAGRRGTGAEEKGTTVASQGLCCGAVG